MNHRSIPPRLGSQPALSVLCVRRRSRRVVALPRFRFALTPSASLSFAVRLRLGLRRAATVHTLPAVRFRSIATRSFGYVPKASTRPAHAARTNHCGGVCTALQSLSQAIPPRVQIQKEGAVSRPLRVSKCQTVNPSVTV